MFYEVKFEIYLLFFIENRYVKILLIVDLFQKLKN